MRQHTEVIIDDSIAQQILSDPSIRRQISALQTLWDLRNVKKAGCCRNSYSRQDMQLLDKVRLVIGNLSTEHINIIKQSIGLKHDQNLILFKSGTKITL